MKNPCSFFGCFSASFNQQNNNGMIQHLLNTRSISCCSSPSHSRCAAWYIYSFGVNSSCLICQLYTTDSYAEEENGEVFRVFTYTQLKSATRSFHSSDKVGEGGFGSVYKVTHSCSFTKLV